MTTVEDIQLLEAQSTIERLRRKYLVSAMTMDTDFHPLHGGIYLCHDQCNFSG